MFTRQKAFDMDLETTDFNSPKEVAISMRDMTEDMRSKMHRL